jgi:hypothetical protein
MIERKHLVERPLEFRAPSISVNIAGSFDEAV